MRLTQKLGNTAWTQHILEHTGGNAPTPHKLRLSGNSGGYPTSTLLLTDAEYRRYLRKGIIHP